MQATTQSARPASASDVVRDEPDALRSEFDKLKSAYRSEPYPSYEQRIAWLDAVLREVRRARTEIAEAIREDFGHRSFHETQIGEIFPLITSIRYAKSHLKSWMKPKSRHVNLALQPARAKVQYQPVGVVGVIAPWNYPVSLALGPLVSALAAGNRVMIKPSEYTPRTSELLKRMLASALPDGVATVISGGPAVAAAFSRLPFDHLLFTGSTNVGRSVMRAAAENLTPVTLELGGKSPAIVHESFPIARAARSIASGKWFNAGQTCIATDYLMVPAAQVDAVVEEIKKFVAEAYPSLNGNADYSSVINEKHYDRLAGLIAEAQAQGARKVEINPAGEAPDESGRKLPPTLLLDVNDNMRVMQEEIFGPVLPIIGYRSIDEAIAYVNDHPRPLALYYFDSDGDRIHDVLQRTISGGVSINDTVIHFVVDGLPFGGVGPSGMGACHGLDGFETFSHKKGVFYQSKLNGRNLLNPPYKDRAEKMLNLLIGK